MVEIVSAADRPFVPFPKVNNRTVFRRMMVASSNPGLAGAYQATDQGVEP
jgi:alpha-D-ribose 1-methylphosphonate 5-triphosphate synthase subunit PhnH